MGLKKTKTLPSAISGEYFNIVEVHNNAKRKDGVIVLELYVSEAIKNAGAEPIWSYQRALGQEFSDLFFDDIPKKTKDIIWKAAYIVFKKQAREESQKPENERDTEFSFFADAIDMLS